MDTPSISSFLSAGRQRQPAACPRSVGNVTQLGTAVDHTVIATRERGWEQAKMHNQVSLSLFAGTRPVSGQAC